MNLLSDMNIHLENKKLSRAFFIFLMLMYSLVYMTKQCFSAALATIVEEGSLTMTQASIISASFYIAYAPLQILGGVFADKYNPERLITIGLFGSALANVVIFFNQNFWVMLIFWIFSAIVQFALWPSVFKIMSSQLVRSDRPRMVFLISFTTYIGMALAYLSAALIPRWQDNFVVSAVILFILAIALIIFSEALSPYLKKDKIIPQTARKNTDKEDHKINQWKIFFSSGFVALLVSAPFRIMIENGGKTMSPTMLFQCYENISPSIGNLLNILIILSGMVGMIVWKGFVKRNWVKNELTGTFIIFMLSLPFIVVMRFVGILPSWLIVASLCVESFFLSAATLLGSMFVMRFIPFELNGTAAGLLNAMQSFGIVVQFCLFGPIAEKLGWTTVTTLWIVLIFISIISISFGLKSSKKFIQETEAK